MGYGVFSCWSGGWLMSGGDGVRSGCCSRQPRAPASQRLTKHPELKQSRIRENLGLYTMMLPSLPRNTRPQVVACKTYIVYSL